MGRRAGRAYIVTVYTYMVLTWAGLPSGVYLGKIGIWLLFAWLVGRLVDWLGLVGWLVGCWRAIFVRLSVARSGLFSWYFVFPVRWRRFASNGFTSPGKGETR